MVAPKIQFYISRFRRNDGGINVDENTEKLVDKLFEIMKEVEPFGDDERRSLWLKADRGTIEEYGDFEEMTASDFFGYCALGYKANNYEMADKLPARELYYKYADGRDEGYYFELAGKSWGRSIETIKFYIALRKAGVAVHLWDAKELRARLLGEDLIGIVPKRVFPRYCESMFPEASVVDFMHLPYEKKAEVVAKTTWHKEPERFLINKSV